VTRKASDMEPGTCPVWQTNCKISVRDYGNLLSVDSPRADGKYTVTKSVAESVFNLTPREKAVLTSWLVEQRRNGTQAPEITSTILQEIESRRPLSFSEKIDRALILTEKNISKIGDELGLMTGQSPTSLGNQMMALTEIQDSDELFAFVQILSETGFIKEGEILGELSYSPTFLGWQRIEQLQSRAVDVTQVFVAMWFHDLTNDAYDKGIRPAIEDSGYRSARIDQKHHVNKIDDEIIAEIRRSRFLVADFTCEPGKPRGGVYYEAGFASALPIPVIWTCKETSIDDLHFDTRQYNHIVWHESSDLYTQLKARIGAVIGDGPLLKVRT